MKVFGPGPSRPFGPKPESWTRVGSTRVMIGPGHDLVSEHSSHLLSATVLNSENPNLSVVVLAYKSADTIAAFVDELVAHLEPVEPHWELVLVGNYFENSGDRTPEVVTRLAEGHPRIRAVTQVKEGMMGWDMRSGLEAATGRVLAVIDGDGQMPPRDVAQAYRLLRENRLDLTKTYRTQRDDGLYRKLVSRVYNAVFKMLFPGLNARDINSKPKVMTRRVYERMDLRSTGWFIDAEIMILARRMRLKTGEIPTVFHSIDSRPSFVKPVSILEFLTHLLWYRVLEFAPRRSAEKKHPVSENP